MADIKYRIELPRESVAKLLRPEKVPEHATLNRWETHLIGGDQRDREFEHMVLVYEWTEEEED